MLVEPHQVAAYRFVFYPSLEVRFECNHVELLMGGLVEYRGQDAFRGLFKYRALFLSETCEQLVFALPVSVNR